MRPPSDDAWEPWTPDHLSARLGPAHSDCYVVGGWALDLWHEKLTRPHEDLEFCVPSNRFDHYRNQLRDLEFFTAIDGKISHLSAAQRLPTDRWQLWGADMNAGVWRIDMMVDRGEPDTWTYKREHSLSVPRSQAIRSTISGINYLAPHLVLLFKAKYRRNKDQHDFNNALDRLMSCGRAELRGLLGIFHPDHAWFQMLDEVEPSCASESSRSQQRTQTAALHP